MFDHMNAKVNVLYQKIDSFSITPSTSVTPTLVASLSPATLYCEICGVNGHTGRVCQMILVGGSPQENANFVNKNQQNNPYLNTYNPGWRDHPNFSYRNNNLQQATEPRGFQKATLIEPKKSNLELSMEKFIEVEESVPTPPKKELVEEVEKEIPYVSPPPYEHIVPFPQRLVKSKVEAQFKKILELLKKIHLNVPFVEALTQMPSYAKFLKEILSNTREINNHETVDMTLDSSDVIQNMVIPKLKDPGSFCTMDFEKALCNLRASVSLMPLPVFKFPISVLEDVPVRVGEYYVSFYFVIMDIDEDFQIPIILGSLFLATMGSLIDVKRGKLTFEAGEENIRIIRAKPLKTTSLRYSCCLVDLLIGYVQESAQKPPPTNKLEECLLSSAKVEKDDTKS
ncbi:uncharacterized protein LOC127130946 [Lathyrus oleraceus]|uniref:uncharacterized protein LOC127130946 n=1 Tax=Pisum sativum TaxID=3888 RepID=UPI0021D19BF2|nr:uncharacterized protein LOC127130946 [Pisum sativum]